MECECRDAMICADYTYGEVCVWLAERRKDCVIVDAGFGGGVGLHEVQRHLRKHGIEARTIGIDIQEWDAEIDEFIHADMRDVRLGPVADVVICRGVVHHFDGSPEAFRDAMESCAGFLKPDGMLFTDLDKRFTWTDRMLRRPPDSVMRAMTRSEAEEHAAECFRVVADRCAHGREMRMRWTMRL